jgi:hypothetical protein
MQADHEDALKTIRGKLWGAWGRGVIDTDEEAAVMDLMRVSPTARRRHVTLIDFLERCAGKPQAVAAITRFDRFCRDEDRGLARVPSEWDRAFHFRLDVISGGMPLVSATR